MYILVHKSIFGFSGLFFGDIFLQFLILFTVNGTEFIFWIFSFNVHRSKF